MLSLKFLVTFKPITCQRICEMKKIFCVHLSSGEGNSTLHQKKETKANISFQIWNRI